LLLLLLFLFALVSYRVSLLFSYSATQRQVWNKIECQWDSVVFSSEYFTEVVPIQRIRSWAPGKWAKDQHSKIFLFKFSWD